MGNSHAASSNRYPAFVYPWLPGGNSRQVAIRIHEGACDRYGIGNKKVICASEYEQIDYLQAFSKDDKDTLLRVFLKQSDGNIALISELDVRKLLGRRSMKIACPPDAQIMLGLCNDADVEVYAGIVTFNSFIAFKGLPSTGTGRIVIPNSSLLPIPSPSEGRPTSVPKLILRVKAKRSIRLIAPTNNTWTEVEVNPNPNKAKIFYVLHEPTQYTFWVGGDILAPQQVFQIPVSQVASDQFKMDLTYTADTLDWIGYVQWVTPSGSIRCQVLGAENYSLEIAPTQAIASNDATKTLNPFTGFYPVYVGRGIIFNAAPILYQVPLDLAPSPGVPASYMGTLPGLPVDGTYEYIPFITPQGWAASSPVTVSRGIGNTNRNEIVNGNYINDFCHAPLAAKYIGSFSPGGNADRYIPPDSLTPVNIPVDSINDAIADAEAILGQSVFLSSLAGNELRLSLTNFSETVPVTDVTYTGDVTYSIDYDPLTNLFPPAPAGYRLQTFDIENASYVSCSLSPTPGDTITSSQLSSQFTVNDRLIPLLYDERIGRVLYLLLNNDSYKHAMGTPNGVINEPLQGFMSGFTPAIALNYSTPRISLINQNVYEVIPTPAPQPGRYLFQTQNDTSPVRKYSSSYFAGDLTITGNENVLFYSLQLTPTQINQFGKFAIAYVPEPNQGGG